MPWSDIGGAERITPSRQCGVRKADINYIVGEVKVSTLLAFYGGLTPKVAQVGRREKKSQVNETTLLLNFIVQVCANNVQ